jgi:hypothetical protein
MTMKNTGRGATTAGILLALALTAGCQTVQRSPEEAEKMLAGAELTPKLRMQLANSAFTSSPVSTGNSPVSGSIWRVERTFRNVYVAGPILGKYPKYCISGEIKSISTLGFFQEFRVDADLISNTDPGKLGFVVYADKYNSSPCSELVKSGKVNPNRFGPFPELERLGNKESVATSSSTDQQQKPVTTE